MDKLAQINVKNINAGQWDRLLKRLPVSPSLIMRALITHALEMSDDEYRKILNKQAAIEAKEKSNE
jgi:hypothetical protein